LRDLDVEIFEGSITDLNLLRRTISNSDHIFHLAARGSVPRSIITPVQTFDVNALGTLNVLEVSKSFEIPITFSSSSSVYGANQLLPKIEESWTLPISPYGASKLSAEALVLSYRESYSIPHRVFRFFNIFGPYQRPEHLYAAVIPKWLWKAIWGEPIILEGDGKQTRDFTFVNDVVNVLVESLNSDNDTELINLAFGVQISLNELIEVIRTFFPKLTVEKIASRKGDIKHSLNNPMRLKQNFPEVEPCNFVDAVKITLDWLKDNKSQILESPAVVD
jgi:UDP-glucose 4-epimerase